MLTVKSSLLNLAVIAADERYVDFIHLLHQNRQYYYI